ncbi:MAG: DNA polymerase ligase N-terminal domain-containing protein [Planctomycetaceae bacterium]
MSEVRRFVILTHDHPRWHWDLMLEAGDVLRTWRLEQEPRMDAEIGAEPLPDHRRLYLDYEGPVSGNRGTVVRWDAGTYSQLDESPDCVTAMIRGERIQGTISLTRRADGEGWIMVVRHVDTRKE